MAEKIAQFFIANNFSWVDVIDILLVSFIIYQLFLLIRGTRAMQMALGIIFIILVYYLSEQVAFRTVHWLFRNFLTYLVIAIIVLFQSEIRRALASFGRNPFIRFFYPLKEFRDIVDVIVLAITTLSSKSIGSIIVMEKETGLKNYIEAGITIDAQVSYDLILSIFNPSSPLHDGAVILKENRIAAAACFLPLTLNPLLSHQLGSRHRAAIGITEETDAVAIVVSEETGSISYAYRGEIKRDLSPVKLTKEICRLFEIEERTEAKFWGNKSKKM
jgi:diadenylate cyclase